MTSATAQLPRVRGCLLWIIGYLIGMVAMPVGGLADAGAQEQYGHINGGDSTQIGGLVVTHIAGHTLYIPKGYVDSFMGFADNLMVHALLPCLEPETASNAAEFRAASIGRRIEVLLTTWESHALEGQRLVDSHIADSQFVKERHPEQSSTDIGPTPVAGTQFVLYRDLLLDRNIFVLTDSRPLFVLNCLRGVAVLGHRCEVWEKIWGNVRLEYHYDGSFVDKDIGNSFIIESRLRALLASFLTPPAENQQQRDKETCK